MENSKIYHGGGMSGSSGFTPSGFIIGGTSDEYLLFKDSANNVDYGFDWEHIDLDPLDTNTNWLQDAGGPFMQVVNNMRTVKMVLNDKIKNAVILPWQDFTYGKYVLISLAFFVQDTSVPDSKSFEVAMIGKKDLENVSTGTLATITLSHSYSSSIASTTLLFAQGRLQVPWSGSPDGPKLIIITIKRTDTTSGDVYLKSVTLDFPVKKIKDSAWFTTGTPMIPPP